MKNDLNDLFFKLNKNDKLQYFPTLLLLDLPTKKELMRGKIVDKMGENDFCSFCTTFYANSRLDLKVGTCFEYLLSMKRPKEFELIHAQLKYVSVNYSYEIDYLPGGYSGLGIIHFDKYLPKLLNQLPYYREKFDDSRNSTLILTQKYILNELGLL